MKGGALALSALTFAACGPPPVPLDAYDPFAELTPEVYLGMRAAELEEVRPDFYLADDGTYSEIVEPWDLVYFFDPKDDDRPPLLTARLVAIQARAERYDSLRLWTEWRERVASYAQSRRLEPDCWVLDDARATLTQAVFSDSLTWRVSAEIHRGPDGREHEAFLSLRLGRGLLETPWEGSLNRHAVGCETLPR